MTNNHVKAPRHSTLSIIILAFIALLLPGVVDSAQAQWATSGTNINNTNTGNVGVGNTTPHYKLDIVGSPDNSQIRFGADASDSGGFLFSIQPAHAQLSAGASWSNFGFTARSMNSSSIAADSGTLRFNTNMGLTPGSAFTPTERMRISASGFVGIGTAGPGYKFDVQGGQINASGGLCIAGDCKTAWSQVGGGSSQWTTAGSNVYYNTGSVGLGTSSPGYKLDVQGGQLNTSGGLCIAGDCKTAWSQVGGGSSPWLVSGSHTYYNSGGVGIGTSTPTALQGGLSGLSGKVFQIQNSSGIAQMNISSAGAGNVAAFGFEVGDATATKRFFQQVYDGASNSFKFRTLSEANGAITQDNILVLKNTGNVGIGTAAPTTALDVNGTVNATGLSINGVAVAGSQWGTSGTTINYAAGNVGIGTAAPTTRLDVNGTVNATGLSINGAAVAGSQWATSGTTINYGTGNVGIGTSAPSAKLHVVGDGRITGNLTVDGNIAAKYQDVAEWVESSQALSTGTVVVLDHTRSNQVIASSEAYDTRVAGVISAQPGIALGVSGAGKVLVATTGRVRIKVDASSGAIHIGDLLVTSDVSGVAMKSVPVEIGGVQIHRPGTLIGKALEPLQEGTGEILVLLSLQ